MTSGGCSTTLYVLSTRRHPSVLVPEVYDVYMLQDTPDCGVILIEFSERDTLHDGMPRATWTASKRILSTLGTRRRQTFTGSVLSRVIPFHRLSG